MIVLSAQRKGPVSETPFHASNRKPTDILRVILTPITISYALISFLPYSRTNTRWYHQVGKFCIEPDSFLTFVGKSATQERKAKSKEDNLDEWTETTRKGSIVLHSLPPVHRWTRTEVGSECEFMARKRPSHLAASAALRRENSAK